MRIALTGATGFVGQHVLPLLLQHGWHVAALARDPQRLQAHPALTVIKGDLANTKALDELCANAAAVLHVAGAIASPTRDGFMAANAGGTANMVEAARRAHVKRFVHVSSLAAREPTLSPYAESKAMAERKVAGRDLSAVILRPAAIYGEGDMATLPLIKALLSPLAVLPGTREGKFALIHVSDFAKVLADALVSTREGVIELGDGGTYSWDDLAAVTRTLYGKPGRMLFLPRGLAMIVGAGGDAVSWYTRRPAMVSRGKMRELYHANWTVEGNGWPGVPMRALNQGLATAVSWYQERGLVPKIPRKAI